MEHRAGSILVIRLSCRQAALEDIRTFLVRGGGRISKTDDRLSAWSSVYGAQCASYGRFISTRIAAAMGAVR